MYHGREIVCRAMFDHPTAAYYTRLRPAAPLAGSATVPRPPPLRFLFFALASFAARPFTLFNEFAKCARTDGAPGDKTRMKGQKKITIRRNGRDPRNRGWKMPYVFTPLTGKLTVYYTAGDLHWVIRFVRRYRGFDKLRIVYLYVRIYRAIRQVIVNPDFSI